MYNSQQSIQNSLNMYMRGRCEGSDSSWHVTRSYTSATTCNIMTTVATPTLRLLWMPYCELCMHKRISKSILFPYLATSFYLGRLNYTGKPYHLHTHHLRLHHLRGLNLSLLLNHLCGWTFHLCTSSTATDWIGLNLARYSCAPSAANQSG